MNGKGGGINFPTTRFEETTEGDRVLVRHGAPGIGCWSMVGKIGGTQNLYLGTDAGE